MTAITEGKFTFSFPPGWHVRKYDDTTFYRKHFQSFAGGSEAVDFLAFNASEKECWLIESKDYRHHPRTKAKDLFEEIAMKVRATLAGLCSMRANAGDDERKFATEALKKVKYRVVFHLEQPIHPSRLRPQIYDPKSLRDKLRQIMRPVDPHALAGNNKILNGKAAWTIT